MENSRETGENIRTKPNLADESVQVVVRCRPLSKQEVDNQNYTIIEIFPRYGVVELTNPKNAHVDGQKTFTFDYAFDQNSTQDDIYNISVEPLVKSVMDGFNGCIFAYGQTGTGKTYTMEGTEENSGIIPKTFQQIWKHIDCTENVQFLVSVSYLEIYLEEIKDLLKRDHATKLEIREFMTRGVVIPNLHTITCKSAQEMLSVMQIGNRNRTTGYTRMNEHSSRSHAIFSIKIEMCDVENEHVKIGKLNLIDLAGSERQSKTGANSERLKEASKINRALSALGNVISALSENSPHIPYRDSKLTRLLQNSLGGNSKTVMIANIGPANYNYDETLTTLRYAHRAKSIKNTPTKNEDPKDTILREYKEEIRRLKQMIEECKLREQLTIVKEGENEEMQKRETLEKDISELTESLALEREKTTELTRKLEILESQLVAGGHYVISSKSAEYSSEKESLNEEEEQESYETESFTAESTKDDFSEDEDTDNSDDLKIETINRSKKPAVQEISESIEKMQMETNLKNSLKSIAAELRQKHDEYVDALEKMENLKKIGNQNFSAYQKQLEEHQKELQLKSLIIENFISSDDKESALGEVYFDIGTNLWMLPKIDESLEKRTYRPVARMSYEQPYSTFALKQMRKKTCAYRFKDENILNLELDMPVKNIKKYYDEEFDDESRRDKHFAKILDRAVEEDSEIEIDCKQFTKVLSKIALNQMRTNSAHVEERLSMIEHNLAMRRDTQHSLRARFANSNYLVSAVLSQKARIKK